MTAKDLISDLPLGPGDQLASLLTARLVFLYLADHIERAELADGRKVETPGRCERTLFGIDRGSAEAGELPVVAAPRSIEDAVNFAASAQLSLL